MSGVPVVRHGLMLGQDEAVASRKHGSIHCYFIEHYVGTCPARLLHDCVFCCYFIEV